MLTFELIEPASPKINMFLIPTAIRASAKAIVAGAPK
jgi:hypothetical protein